MPLFLGEDKITRVIMSVESADGGTNTNDATLSSGAQMLQGVTAYSKGTKYIGTIATVEGPTPDISVSSDGLIAASVSNPKGYQAGSTTNTATQQLTTKGATTITPSSASQIAVNSGVYTTGKITVSAVPTETKKITANGTYSPSAGKYFSSVEVAIAGDTPTYQSKTISPSTSIQTITADSGYDALSDVTVNAIQTETKSVTPTISTQKVTPTSGKYLTEVSVGAIQTETKSVTSNGTYNPTSGKYFSQVTVNVPSSGIDTSDATATADDIVKDKTAYIKGKKITGNIKTVNSTDTGSGMNFYYADFQSANNSIRVQIEEKRDELYRNGSYCNVYVPGITFGNASPKDVAAGKTFTSVDGLKIKGTATTETSTPTLQTKSVTPTKSEQVVTPDSGYDGLSSVTVEAMSIGILSTPSINTSTGIVTAGVSTAGYLDTSATKTLQLTTKSAATITPSTTDQTIGAGQYLTGTQTIKGDGNLVPENIISGKSIFGVSGSVVIQKYYTGTSDPSSSLGNDGDIYLKV